MAKSWALPYHFVNHLTDPGLPCAAGRVKLNSYLSATNENGGADSAKSLIGNLREKVRDGGNGPTLQALYGNKLDRVWMGQGHPDVIAGVWDFICRNKQQMGQVHVDLYARRAKGAADTKVFVKGGNVHELFFEGRSDAAALQAMVAARCFGLDCIGFAGQFLVYAHHWDQYIGWVPSQWPEKICTVPVNKASEIRPLDILVWSGHVALVDWIWKTLDEREVRIDVCQSSSRGPECNSFVDLRETNVFSSERRLYRFTNLGTPAMPVHKHCRVMRIKDFYW